ncbi:MAG TPA: polysaccharide deacetylase family protein [Firmicutes bacterium]|nr:polysaccharide deacetylase family protein [Bacillota bacterium]
MKIVYFGTGPAKGPNQGGKRPIGTSQANTSRCRQALSKLRRRVIWYGGAASVLCALLLLAAPGEQMVFQTAQNEQRKLPIYCVQTDQKQVAISFDAAWGADDTDTLLTILQQENVPATFFLCGYWVEKYPEEVQKIAAAGHTLGNHSSTHPHMASLDAQAIRHELRQCGEAVEQLTGQKMELFRAPFGEYDNEVIEIAAEEGYYTIQWDVDTHPAKEKEKQMIWQPFSMGVKNGASGGVEPGVPPRFYFQHRRIWPGPKITF